jgi:hypothetical protein
VHKEKCCFTSSVLVWLSIVPCTSLHGHHDKILQTKWLKQHEFNFHSSGIWEVQDHGAHWFSSLMRDLFLVCHWLPPLCVLTCQVSRSKLSSIFYEGTCIPSLRFILIASPKLNYLTKIPFPNVIPLTIRASTHELREDTIQSIITCH